MMCWVSWSWDMPALYDFLDVLLLFAAVSATSSLFRLPLTSAPPALPLIAAAPAVAVEYTPPYT